MCDLCAHFLCNPVFLNIYASITSLYTGGINAKPPKTCNYCNVTNTDVAHTNTYQLFGWKQLEDTLCERACPTMRLWDYWSDLALKWNFSFMCLVVLQFYGVDTSGYGELIAFKLRADCNKTCHWKFRQKPKNIIHPIQPIHQVIFMICLCMSYRNRWKSDSWCCLDSSLVSRMSIYMHMHTSWYILPVLRICPISKMIQTTPKLWPEFTRYMSVHLLPHFKLPDQTIDMMKRFILWLTNW